MLSCLPVSIFGDICQGKMKVSDWSMAAKEMGLDGFDITISFVRDRTPHGLSEMRKEIEASGLPCLVMSMYPDLTDLTPGVYEKELIRAMSDISVAADLGVQNARITIGQFHPEFADEDQLNQGIQGILECKKFADKVGVGLLWENHSKPGAWDHPDYNYDYDRVVKMRDRLKGTGVFMNYDVANADLVGRGPEFLKECLPEVRSIHLNDVATKDPIKFAGVFHGCVPIEENLKVLRDANYKGVISVEEAAFEGLSGIRRYMAETKEMLKKYELL